MRKRLENILAETPHLLLRDDPCKAAEDHLLGRKQTPVYVPLPDYETAMKTLSNPEQVRPFDPSADQAKFYGRGALHGLLYLPYPYLVPGGRFNEMYGWDTAFPVFAWADDYPKIMREQVDNQLYQIRMYGKVLNANRTHYISRSQPPLIAAMALRVWQAAQKRAWEDFDPDGVYPSAEAWLEAAFTALKTYHEYWMHEDRRGEGLTLSRYWDDADLPAPEAASSEEGHFAHAIAHFERKDLPPEVRQEHVLFYDEKNKSLRRLYYRADRTQRASGFDPTGHWGYGGLRCMFHTPVCLNSLLYRMETDMAEIAAALQREDEAVSWKNLAVMRRDVMRRVLQDPETKIFHDYNFSREKLNKRPFASFFHALWAGLYDDAPADARKAAMAVLEQLEMPYGISMSTEISGSQWDHPYGWPPIQYFAFEGLRRCGMKEEARRVAQKFVDLTLRVFADRGALFEKYDVVLGNSEVHVVHGYHENATEKGTFLWTAAVLKMARDLLGVTP